MSAPAQNAAILFADISGSTALYDKLGNEAALQLITRTFDILTREMSARQGTLIKTIGDEIMCSFPDAVTAIDAASAMQTALKKERPGGDQAMYVRIGVNYGEVIFEGGDAYGDAVNVAARITSITRARQIMTTRNVVSLLPSRLRNMTRRVMRAEFRGKEETFDVFQIVWEEEDTVSTRIGKSAFRKTAGTGAELMLRYHQQVVTVGEKLKSVLLGRADDCGLTVHNSLASRQHAHIEYSFGKFLLTDHSMNGTYIRFADDQVVRLTNQQIVLHGAGTISLGQAFSENPTEVINYLVQ